MGYQLKLISEHTAHDQDYLIEQDEKSGKKNYKIRGVFMQADIKNRNGRMYPMEILSKEVTRYNKEYVNENRAYGELGHPDGPTVNLERASHMITSLKADGKNFIGEAKILSTPMGEIVKSLMDSWKQCLHSALFITSLLSICAIYLFISHLCISLMYLFVYLACGHGSIHSILLECQVLY